jgi:hypothetical protein
VNDLYKENYKLLKKEIEEDYKTWKDVQCSVSFHTRNWRTGGRTGPAWVCWEVGTSGRGKEMGKW